MLQEFHLLAGKLEQQCKDVEAGEDSNGGEKGGGGGGEGGGEGGGWRKLLEKTRREMLEAAGLALQVALHLDQMAITMKLLIYDLPRVPRLEIEIRKTSYSWSIIQMDGDEDCKSSLDGNVDKQ